MSEQHHVRPANAKVVARDLERFKRLFTNCRPRIPVGYTASVMIRTSRQLIADRLCAIGTEPAATN